MFTLGTAYSPVRPLTLSVDTNVPMALNTSMGLSSTSESIWVATGMNLALTSFWAVQAGLNLKPGLPRLTTGTTVNLDKISINVSYTVDLVTTLAVPDRLAVEVKLDLGDLGRQEAEDRAREYYLAGLDAYAKGNLEDAIVQWDKALEILPTFLPAKELKATAEKALELRKTMEQSQKIE
jgi:hypothetical protein